MFEMLEVSNETDKFLYFGNMQVVRRMLQMCQTIGQKLLHSIHFSSTYFASLS